ncbi:divergent protein kinase domain 1A-like [Apostichopus japonicus]|uniref:divergent protein kinase domain 1A-like n=1 Tax=Stichopus japonicus TaxID=307972 RepID=UPI003AB8B267
MRRRKQQLMAFVLSSICLFLFWMMFLSEREPSDVYLLQQSLSFTCYFYQKKIVSGNLCQNLCQRRNLYIDQCLSCKTQYKVFTGQLYTAGSEDRSNVLIKHFQVDDRSLYLDSDMFHSEEDLRGAISSHLQLKFGQFHFEDLIRAILILADSDNNEHISRAEARTMISLMMNNDFIMTVVLAGNDKVPNLIGYCGDIFVTEGVDSYRLQADAESWDLFTSLPPWPTRVRIAVSILEFVEDIQDLFLGNLLLCSLSDASIGLVSEEASFYNLEWLASETQIREHLKYHPCVSSEDCTYGPNCATQCGPMGMCISNTTRINLPQTCSILETFITRGAPRTFYPKLKGLVDRCIAMDPARKDIFMKHSLVLNDLKNSLWYEIHLL